MTNVTSDSRRASAGFRTFTYVAVLISDSEKLLSCYWEHIFRVSPVSEIKNMKLFLCLMN
jgi:hypothetical protein